jgi:hypothetical protein
MLRQTAHQRQHYRGPVPSYEKAQMRRAMIKMVTTRATRTGARPNGPRLHRRHREHHGVSALRWRVGHITNHDEITVILIEPTDGTPPLVRVHWPLRHTTAAATHYPAEAVAIVRIIAESATALARHKAGGT